MSVKCSKGIWQLKSETGEIYSHYGDVRRPIATVSGLSFPEEDFENCVANAVLISKSARMYSLLLFVKNTLQCLYREFPDGKGLVFEYIEGCITQLEDEMDEKARLIIANEVQK